MKTGAIAVKPTGVSKTGTPEIRRQHVDHGRPVEGLHDRPVPAAHREEVQGQEGEEGLPADVLAAPPDHPEAIGVAIERQAQGRIAILHHPREARQIGGDRLGGANVGEQGIGPAVDLDDLRRPLGEERGQEAGSGTVHRIDGDGQARPTQRLEIEVLAERGEIAIQRVDPIEVPVVLGGVEGPPGGGLPFHGQGGDTAFHRLQETGRGRCPGLRVDFDAAELGRVMGSGDHEAAIGVALDDRLADRLRGDRGGCRGRRGYRRP